jgi:CHAT domain-containing protein
VTLSGKISEINRDGRGEELVALQRAWLYAGAKTVLMRLWNTKDCDTEALLNAFYIRWMAVQPVRLLHCDERCETCGRFIQTPYYWAAFIICGQG